MSGKSKDNRKLVLLLIASISVVVLIYCVIRLALYSLSSYNANKEISDLKEKTELADSALTPLKDKDAGDEDQNSGLSGIAVSKYKSLYEENKDFAGWIKIEGTKIDYPVMQTPSDEEYYLHRNFKKLSSDEGLPFIDARSDIVRPSSNIIIYGHNMKSGDMFADLLKYDDYDFYSEHQTIVFDTIFAEGTYTVISVFRTDVSDDSNEDFKFYKFINNTSSYPLSKYLSEIKSCSKHSIPFDPEKVTGLITLSTCEYTKKDGRFVIVAAKMSDI
ncbi:MAG: class B sortase [Lachnospiraceae bacterium]|nr:class B sortase [Lachnospiraceae bacterium]